MLQVRESGTVVPTLCRRVGADIHPCGHANAPEARLRCWWRICRICSISSMPDMGLWSNTVASLFPKVITQSVDR